MNKKGITLIALIITVIVLLILAGTAVSISLNGGDIFTKATTARAEWNAATNQEEDMLQDMLEMLKNPTLVSQITSDDYGKSINYSVTIDGDNLTNWKIFYNNGTNVYLIYGDYIENKYIDSIYNKNTSVSVKAVSGKLYNVTTTDEYHFVTYLRRTDYWTAFAAGYEGATATATPTLGEINLSLNRSSNSLSSISGDLYLPHNEIVDECEGYWLATEDYYASSWWIKYVSYNGSILRGNDGVVDEKHALRPVICLPSTATGTIGSSVVLDK